jgi:Ca2+:H+ antiporter
VNALAALTRKQRIVLGVALLATVLAGVFDAIGAGAVLTFVVSAVALAVLASIVGDATEQVGSRLGPGATGVLQSAIGNLPELFVAIFALRAGLLTVVQTALVGSILSNSLLVLGLAFVAGGLRHGEQRFDSRQPRMIATLTLLAVSALMVPTLAALLHTPAEGHEGQLGLFTAVLLLVIFAASIPFAIRGGPTAVSKSGDEHEPAWPIWLAVALLALAGVGAAFVSDWFVTALEPAIETLGISQAFAGLVIVAIAGNAVENVVGIQLAMDNRPDYAISVILNSSLQVALALTPILVLLSFVVSSTAMTLVLPPLLLAALFLAAILSAVIVFDGESNWLEGLALIGLYGIVAASFWWG